MFQRVLDTARQAGDVTEDVGTALNNLASVLQSQVMTMCHTYHHSFFPP